METLIVIVLAVGVVLWIRSLSYKANVPPRQAPAAVPGVSSGAVGPVLRQPPLIDPHQRGDGAFFDGYIWGRLEERQEQRQEDAKLQQHDHDFDHDSDVSDDDWDDD